MAKWPYMDKTALFSVSVCNSEADPDGGAGGAPSPTSQKQKKKVVDLLLSKMNLQSLRMTLPCLHSVEDLAYSCRSLTLDLNAVSHWAKVWGMLYNAEKSQHLTVRSKHVRVSSPPISMGGVTVPQVDHQKHLGIHINKSLTWTDHVNEDFSSCARRIGMLLRLRRILPNAAIRRIYIGSIRPILEYACPLSVVEVRLQSWWSCKNRSATAIMLRFCLWKNDFFFRSKMLLEVPLKLGLKRIQILSNSSPNRVIETITEHPRIPLDT